MYHYTLYVTFYPGGLRPDRRARCFSASAGEHGKTLWTGQRGTEKYDKEFKKSKQSYGKQVIAFVKLTCLFCKASAPRRSIDLIFFCKVISATSDVLFVLTLFFQLLVSILEVLGHLWRAFGPSERPVRFWTSFLRSFFDFWSALGAQEAPKGAPRSAKATKMVPKVIQKGAKSDFERVFF